MSDINEKLDADQPDDTETDAEQAAEATPFKKKEGSEPGTRSGHVAALDDVLANVNSDDHDDEDAGPSNPSHEYSQSELERLERIVSAPWLQSLAAYNQSASNLTNSLGVLTHLDLPSLGISRQVLEGINQMLQVARPDLSQMTPALGKAVASLNEMQFGQSESLKSVSEYLAKVLGTSLRRATLAGFARKTQEWLTTTDALRYRSSGYVWHYTNGYACLSIIKSGNLWASSPESLNDASEMIHGLGVIREAFARVKSEAAEEDLDSPEEWETVNLVMNEVLDEAYFDTILNEVYYISASSQPDSLTLWRNYANGDGFALGLSTKTELSADGIALNEDTDAGTLRDDVPPISGWYRVTYKKGQKDRLATEFIQNAIDDIDRAGESDHEALVKELRKQAVILASVMKHDAFADEKEVRWITTNFTNFDPVHYEHGRRSIVPVLHVRTASQGAEALLPLKGVRCSPVAPDGIERTIQGLLRQKDYLQASANVTKSKQPFKG